MKNKREKISKYLNASLNVGRSVFGVLVDAVLVVFELVFDVRSVRRTPFSIVNASIL